jgi:hypothetical protein
MELKLVRLKYQQDGVFGELRKGAKTIAYTLEHSYDIKAKLPPGTYKCVRGMHKLQNGVPFETFEITKVPGHWGMLFHAGNWEKDSSGCVLLGEAIVPSKQGTMVTNSKATFREFMDLLKGLSEFTLTVQE